MFLNFQTTYPNGGWMYFKINNDDYMQLSGSDNTVDIYTSISGNLNVAGRILIDGSHLNVQPKSSTSSRTLVLDQSFSTEFGSDSHGINVYGRQGGNSHLKFYNGRSGSVCNVLTDGNLDVGSTGNNSIKIHGTGATTSYAEFKVSNGQDFVWDFQNPSNSNVWSTIKVKGVKLMGFSPNDNIIIHYKPFANWSDDRLKENAIFIEKACETLSKLRPQLYYKKPDMENDDPTTWYKESGLIAQEIYYDAPEL